MESKSRRIRSISIFILLFIPLLMVIACKGQITVNEGYEINENVRIDWYYLNPEKNFSRSYILMARQIDSLSYRFVYQSEDDSILNDYLLKLNCGYSKLFLKEDTINIRIKWKKEYDVNGEIYPVYNFKLFEEYDDGVINAYWTPKLGVIHYFNLIFIV